MKKNNKKIAYSVNNLKKLELLAGRKRYEALPQLFFVLGICAGFVINLSTNILHDSLKQFGGYYEIPTLTLTAFFFIWILRYINKHYLIPIDNIEKLQSQLIKSLKNPSNNK